MNIPIFDSLAHPTITKKWLNSNQNTSFLEYSSKLEKLGYKNGLAIGIANIEQYEHKLFYEQASQFKNLTPIAGIDVHAQNIFEEIYNIKKIGYKGVKIHSRFNNIDLKSKLFKNILHELNNQELPLILCTYLFNKSTNFYINPFDLFKLFENIEKTKILLAHGGVFDILTYSELSKQFDNIFIDLSFTINKYKGSSLDNDIRYLFENLDQKLTIGSDFPDFDLSETKKRFDFFSKGLSKRKKENIAYANLEKFIGL